uniref:Uncharacterized protein n=1 Tax=Soybean thrips denso-like virus 2 TaxID=2803989 RepID=A0A7T8E848_9VIRU|nr:putative protein 4 [Soybean thrips denso-like virus 2]
MLREYLPVPAFNVVLMKEYTMHPKLLYVNRNHKCLIETVCTFERMLHSTTFMDLLEIIESAPQAKFQAIQRVQDYYGNLQESTELLKKLFRIETHAHPSGVATSFQCTKRGYFSVTTHPSVPAQSGQRNCCSFSARHRMALSTFFEHCTSCWTGGRIKEMPCSWRVPQTRAKLGLSG